MYFHNVKTIVLSAAETIENNKNHMNSKNLTEKVNNLLMAVETDMDQPLDKISDDALASKEIENMTIELFAYHTSLKF